MTASPGVMPVDRRAVRLLDGGRVCRGRRADRSRTYSPAPHARTCWPRPTSCGEASATSRARADFRPSLQTLLNQFARDGVRVRSYAIDAGGSVQCAVWEDDQVLVTRLRGDFRGVTAVDAVMRLRPAKNGAARQTSRCPRAARADPRASRGARAPRAGSPDASDAAGVWIAGRRDPAQYVFDHRGARDQPVDRGQ